MVRKLSDYESVRESRSLEFKTPLRRAVGEKDVGRQELINSFLGRARSLKILRSSRGQTHKNNDD